jgi:uncharacterized protein YceH (UPF0502 family)
MNVDEDQVGRALETLRAAGVVAEIYGSGRVPRYRHYGYEWFGGIEKEDLSILAELLLRGEQSEGDLRGRASRMDPIPDLQILRTRLDGLAARGLVVWLSPPGRGRRRSSRRCVPSSAWPGSLSAPEPPGRCPQRPTDSVTTKKMTTRTMTRTPTRAP